MKVVMLAAGAGGMYCGSCMHDNRLAATLIRQGRDVTLVPLYTPLRTDEEDVSTPRVYYGGINVYLQQSLALFRHTPWVLDRLFDARPLLRAAGRYASSTRPEDLGPMTLSVLRGEHGAQRKELEKLIEGLRPMRPRVVYFPNLMFIGFARRIKEALAAPIVCSLSGEDIFLDRLPQPYREQVFAELRQRAQSDVDAFVALTDYYAAHATQHFSLPAERVHSAHMGIDVTGFAKAAPASGPFTIGYLARVCPDKGFGQICTAFKHLRAAGHNCRLHVAGFLGQADRPFFERCVSDLRNAGAGDAFEHHGEVTRERKQRFLQSLHALAAPTEYAESKGYYILEALAAGVPVVVPEHGAFPELIAATGGGLLHAPRDAQATAAALQQLMQDEPLRARLADAGHRAVHASFTADHLATRVWQIFEQFA